MERHDSIRLFHPGLSKAGLLVSALVSAALPCHAIALPFPHQQQAPAPIERRSPQARSAGAGPETMTGAGPYSGAPQAVAPLQRRPAPQAIRGGHLAQWMTQHSSLSPQQKQQALEQEPGFRDLPSQTQQRMLDRLAQLDAMTPAQRQRRLAQTEAMERLTPDQRAEVRGAMSQLGMLPDDQRHAVARTFRALRELPPDQRAAAMNSGRFGPPLNDTQRAVLGNLLRVEPMLPPPARALAPSVPMQPGTPYGQPYPPQ